MGFERYTDRARKVITLAQEIARAEGSPEIDTEHLLLGLVQKDGGIASQALLIFGVEYDALRTAVLNNSNPTGTPAGSGNLSTSSGAKWVQELALVEGIRLGDNYVGTEHLLLGLIREGKGVGVRALKALGVELPWLKEKTEELHYGATVKNSKTPLVLFCNGSHIPLSRVAEEVLIREVEKASGHPLVFRHLRR